MTNQKMYGVANGIALPSKKTDYPKNLSIQGDPQTLVAAIREGDVKAFSEFYIGYSDSIVRFLTRFLGNVDDAKEITQETFVLLWENREKLDPHKSIKAYTGRMARNKAVDMIRARNKFPESDMELTRYDGELAGFADEELLAQEIEILYRDVLRRMPPQRRKIYLMSRDEGLSYQEIAQRLGLSCNTIRNHIAQALEDIRSVLIALLIFAFITPS